MKLKKIKETSLREFENIQASDGNTISYVLEEIIEKVNETIDEINRQQFDKNGRLLCKCIRCDKEFKR